MTHRYFMDLYGSTGLSARLGAMAHERAGAGHPELAEDFLQEAWERVFLASSSSSTGEIERAGCRGIMAAYMRGYRYRLRVTGIGEGEEWLTSST